MKATGRFYVYEIRDPRPSKNHAPIYVGKGTGNRADDHSKRAKNRMLAGIIAKCHAAGLSIIIKKVRHFENEIAAFAYEMELIARYGRRDLGTGTLCNMTAGGDGIDNETIQRMWASPEFRATHKVGCERRSADPAWQVANRAAIEQLTIDPKWQAAQKAGAQRTAADPSWVAKVKENGKRNSDNPEWQAAHKARIERQWANPKRHETQRNVIIRLAANPEWRAAQKTGAQRIAANPMHRAAKKAAWANPDIRAKRIAGIKRAFADPEKRAKLVAQLEHGDPEMHTKRTAALRHAFTVRRARKFAVLDVNPNLTAPELATIANVGLTTAYREIARRKATSLSTDPAAP